MIRQLPILLIALALAGIGFVFAQGPSAGGPSSHGRGGGPQGWRGGGPGSHDDVSWAQRRVQFFGARLNLSDAQKQQALSIFTTADQNSAGIEEKLGEARMALRDATRRNASTAEIDQLAGVVGTLTGHLMAVQAKADAAFYQALAPDQKEKMDQRPTTREMQQRKPRRDH